MTGWTGLPTLILAVWAGVYLNSFINAVLLGAVLGQTRILSAAAFAIADCRHSRLQSSSTPPASAKWQPCQSRKRFGSRQGQIAPCKHSCLFITHEATLQDEVPIREDDERDDMNDDEVPIDDDEDVLAPENYDSLPEGMPKGFYIVRQYTFTPDNVVKDLSSVWLSEQSGAAADAAAETTPLSSDPHHVDRLELTHDNVTLPVALMMLDPISYPSLSRARKACRKGNILIQRHASHGVVADQDHDDKDAVRFIGRVGDRIYTGDAIGQQVRMGDGYFSVVGHRPPPFVLPVVYQDDHMALVNKPAGVVCYRQGSGHTGLLSVRAALPFVLTPPARGTYSVLRRPASVHRLDKPTSGILCIVKTKPAMLSMSRQFHDRIVKKTYMAIVNGIPEEQYETSITSQQARQLGVDIDMATSNDDTRWQLIDAPLDDKHAVTVWRAVDYVPSIHANDGTLTLVELKPKTGRYHQLRRHLAWHCQRPIVGDDTYDGGTTAARKFRDRGLFLCATRVTHQHPYYNTAQGRAEWDQLPADHERKFAGGTLWQSPTDDQVMVTANIDLPDKFHSLLSREKDRYTRLSAPVAESQLDKDDSR